MSFIFCTGTLAVVATEIDWLIQPAMRVAPSTHLASWGEMAAAAKREYPTWTLQSLNAPHASRFTAQAVMRRPDGQRSLVWVDPSNARVTGNTTWWSAQRWLRDTHRHLLLPVVYGVPIVIAISVPLLLAFFSSFFICKQWWRGFIVWPRKGKPRLLWGDIHRLVGVWSLAFMALVGATGAWYFVESLGGKAPPLPQIILPKSNGPQVSLIASEVDLAVANARKSWPGWIITSIRPSADGSAMLFYGRADGWLVRDRANAVGVNLKTGEILGRRAGVELGGHQRLSEMADPLHLGSFGGWPVRWLWFVFGLMLSSLPITGAFLYGIRVAEGLRVAQRKGLNSTQGGDRGPWRLAWQRMGRWRWALGGVLGIWVALALLRIIK